MRGIVKSCKLYRFCQKVSCKVHNAICSKNSPMSIPSTRIHCKEYSANHSLFDKAHMYLCRDNNCPYTLNIKFHYSTYNLEKHSHTRHIGSCLECTQAAAKHIRSIRCHLRSSYCICTTMKSYYSFCRLLRKHNTQSGTNHMFQVYCI